MSRNIVAVEIGSSKIKGAIGQVDLSGTLTVTGIEEEHQHPNYVRYGCVQNVKEVANELNRVITKLNNRLAPEGRIKGVYVGVGGRSMRTDPARLHFTLPEQTEVTPEIVEEMLGRARIAGSDRFLLDVEAIDYQLDGKSQGTDPVGVIGRELSAGVNLINCRTQLLSNIRLAITDKLDLKINGCIVRPMALADLLLTGDEKRLGTMLVDCGAETTTTAIYKGGALIYLATIPLGSRHITRDLMALPCLEEKAEELKRTVGNANYGTDGERRASGSIDEIDLSEINSYVSARAGEIVANVVAQIEYAGLTAADLPGGIVLAGGGSLLQGFAEVLASVSGMNVRRGSLPPTVRVSGSRIPMPEDFDVIALLYRLASEDTVECVEKVAPKAEPEQQPTQYDDFDDDDEDDLQKKKNGPSFFGRIFSSIKKGVTPQDLDEFDTDE